MQISLHKDFHAVEHEDLAFAGLANLIAIEQLELTCTFVMVIFDADASAPLLDLALGGPELDIYRIGTVEN